MKYGRKINKTGTSKVGARSKAQKAQKTFFEKKNEFFFFQKMSHGAEKCKRGDPLGFINIYSVAKYQKTQKGTLLKHQKNFEESRTMPKKKSKGGTL